MLPPDHKQFCTFSFFKFFCNPYVVSYGLRRPLWSVFDTASYQTMRLRVSSLKVATQQRQVHVHVIVCFHHLSIDDERIFRINALFTHVA